MKAFFAKIVAFLMSVVYAIFPSLAPAQPSTDDYKVNGGLLYVYVDTNASTGYSWELISGNDKVIILKDRSYESKAKDKNIVGAGAKETITFEAVAQGDFTLVLSYERVFEENSSVRTITVKGSVDKDGNITVSEFKK